MKNIYKIIKLSDISVFLLLTCLLMAFISSLLSVIPIQFIGFIFDVLAGRPENTVTSRLILEALNSFSLVSSKELLYSGIGLFLVFSIISMVFRILFCYAAEMISERIILSIRKKLFAKSLKMTFLQYLNKPKGQVMHTIISDTEGLENIFSRPFYTMFSDIFDLIWISAFIIVIDPVIFAVLVLTLPLLYLVSIKTAKVQRQVALNIQETDAALTSNIEQTLSGFETVKALNGESYEEANFESNLAKSYLHRKKGVKNLSIFFPLEGGIRNAGFTVILFYTVSKVISGALQIGMIPVLIDYVNKFYSPVRNISQYYQTLQRGIASSGRIVEFFNLYEEELPAGEIKNDSKGADIVVSAQNLSVVVNNKTLVRNINFECSKGELILVKGESGSGKTSLLRALMGFYPVEKSQLFIMGNDINSYSKRELRKKISYSGQNVFLHNTTLEENVAYPDEKHEESEVIHDTLHTLKLNKVDHSYTVGEEGKRLSGGEKARISFARSIIKNRDIIILDEATAALDHSNAETIINILSEQKQRGKVIFFATHSNHEALIRCSDQIVTIEAHND